MSVWCTQGHICTSKSQYVFSSLVLLRRKCFRNEPRGSGLFLPNFSLTEYGAYVGGFSESSVHWHLERLHLFGHLQAKLNPVKQGYLRGFWSCCQVLQSFSSLALILCLGCPSHQSPSHRFGGSYLLPFPVYQAFLSSVMRSLHSFSSWLPSPFPLTGGWHPSLQGKGRRKYGSAFLLCTEWCVGQPGALGRAGDEENMGL